MLRLRYTDRQTLTLLQVREGKSQHQTSQATNENLVFPAKVIKELARELKNLDESPPEDIAVFVNEENFSNITADIEGPYGTPYEGGVFRMKLILSHDFPQTPPKEMRQKLGVQNFVTICPKF